MINQTPENKYLKKFINILISINSFDSKIKAKICNNYRFILVYENIIELIKNVFEFNLLKYWYPKYLNLIGKTIIYTFLCLYLIMSIKIFYILKMKIQRLLF